MDGIAGITGRIAGIRQTLAALAPHAPVAATNTLTTKTSMGSSADTPGSFASVLAGEVASRSGSATPSAPTAGSIATTATLTRPSYAAAPVASPSTSLAVQHVGAYGPKQLANAAAIVEAGKAMGLSARDQTIGVMTAMGESSLNVVNHGDIAGPDSRGLFQQRDNGAWGSLTDRMNPTISATNFFKGLAGVDGRDGMDPTAVAHKVQRNADPNHYTKYWDSAVAVVKAVG